MIPQREVCEKCWGKWWNDEFDELFDKELYVCYKSKLSKITHNEMLKRTLKIKKKIEYKELSETMKRLIGSDITFRNLFIFNDFDKMTKDNCPYILEHIVGDR